MENLPDLETKANLYASSQIRALRGSESRVAFGERIGMKESLLFKYERGLTNLTVSKLARLAQQLGMPFSYFMLPDDDPAFHEDENRDGNEEEKVA